MNWKQAFLEQSENDFSIFCEFYKLKKPRCQQLHYLQMTTEKLAKAHLCSKNNIPPKTTHIGFSKFLQQIKGQPDFQRKLGYKNKNSAYDAYIDSLVPLAQSIEQLAPEGKQLNKPNPEYPWKSGIQVLAPLHYEFKNIYDQESQLNKLIDLIRQLLTVV